MGSLYSYCYDEKNYFLVVLGGDDKLKKKIYTEITKAEFSPDNNSRYEEKKVRLNGLKTIVCCLDDDKMTHDLWSVHINCANACVFVCNPDMESPESIEKAFDQQFGKKLENKNFSVLVVISSQAKSLRAILGDYRNLKNVCLLHIDDTCLEKNQLINEGIEWMVDNMQA